MTLRVTGSGEIPQGERPYTGRRGNALKNNTNRKFVCSIRIFVKRCRPCCLKDRIRRGRKVEETNTPLEINSL